LGAVVGGIVAGAISGFETGGLEGAAMGALMGGAMGFIGGIAGAVLPAWASTALSLISAAYQVAEGNGADVAAGFMASLIAGAAANAWMSSELSSTNPPPAPAAAGSVRLPKDEAIRQISSAAINDGAKLVEVGRDYAFLSKGDTLIVVTHSNGDSVWMNDFQYGPRMFANYMAENGLTGKRIQLYACSTGQGSFAQGLAYSTRVPVNGALGYVSAEHGGLGASKVMVWVGNSPNITYANGTGWSWKLPGPLFSK
jgi:hypothetical protein